METMKVSKVVTLAQEAAEEEVLDEVQTEEALVVITVVDLVVQVVVLTVVVQVVVLTVVDLVVQAVLARVVVLTEAQGRCIRQSVLNARKNVKFLSSQPKANLCIAENVFKNTEVNSFTFFILYASLLSSRRHRQAILIS